MTDTARPIRMCESCGGVDDHPRHVHGTADGDSPTSVEAATLAGEYAFSLGDPEVARTVMAQIQNTSTQVKHLDCCARDGCPDTSCVVIHELAPGSSVNQAFEFGDGDGVTRGDDLLSFLTSGSIDHVGTELSDAQYALHSEGEK